MLSLRLVPIVVCLTNFLWNLFQYVPETSPENVTVHGPPQVMLAYLEYQYSLGDDVKRKEAFVRLQVYIFPPFNPHDDHFLLALLTF